MLRLIVHQEELGRQVSGHGFRYIAWELSTNNDADPERTSLSGQSLQPSAVAHTMRLVENDHALQLARLFAPQGITMELDDDDFGKSRLDFIGWQIAEL